MSPRRLSAQVIALEPVIVSATRAAAPQNELPYSIVRYDATELRASPAATLDSALRSHPGFGLFRRSDSLTAHPTSQGVSLRGMGPSGASRTLVLLDGVPLNDPFGGWITWNKVPAESLASAELVPQGGATAWGNSALSGVVQLVSASPHRAVSQFAASGGDFQTFRAETWLAQPLGPGTLEIGARAFDTAGFHVIADRDRGSIDVPASSEHRWLRVAWTQPIGTRARAGLMLRGFEESRGNGTPHQQNRTKEQFVSSFLSFQLQPFLDAHLNAYVQSQRFSSTFSAVNAARSAETPASDQFAVPATAYGTSMTLRWRGGEDVRVSGGWDLRAVRGETRENFFFSSGEFQRQRHAGGRQLLAGAFAQYEQRWSQAWRSLIGVRVDRWEDSKGQRREVERATGTVVREDILPGRHGTRGSPSAGVIWLPAKALRLHASVQQAFRRPTLNELYRPFRQGSDITEPNAGLGTESALNREIGASWAAGPLRLATAIFHNTLKDAVSNVTVASGPANVDGFGFIPAGGSGRRRLNIDRIRVRGLDARANWSVSGQVEFSAHYLFNDVVVRESAVASALVGLRLAGVPRHTLSLGGRWQPHARLGVNVRARWVGRQFDDDLNEETLPPAWVFDASVVFQLRPQLDLFVSAENVANQEVATARGANGVTSVGTPRFLFGGVRFRR